MSDTAPDLREALKPFAKAAQHLEGLADGCPLDYDLTVSDFRRAALASASASSTEEIEGLIAELEAAAVRRWGTNVIVHETLEGRAARALRTLSSRATAMPVRGEVIEECATVAENFDYDGLLGDELPKGWEGCRRLIAKALRTLKDSPHG